MMRAMLTAAVMMTATAAGGEDRFAPDNPWFRDFENTCRSKAEMLPDCYGSVLGAYAEFAAVDQESVTCDFMRFWQVKDEQFGTDLFAALPWQYGVEAIISVDGVCAAAPDLGL